MFGELPIESVSVEAIERWVASFEGRARTRNNVLIQLHGILARARRVYGLRVNAAADVEKFPLGVGGSFCVQASQDRLSRIVDAWRESLALAANAASRSGD